MTDIQIAYRELREAGHGHHRALRELAKRLATDKTSIARTLKRAEFENGPTFEEPARRESAA